MEGVFRAKIDVRCNGETRKFSLSTLMASSSLVEIFKMAVELPLVLKYLDVEVLLKLANVKLPESQEELQLVKKEWRKADWTLDCDLPACIVSLKTWLRSKDAKIKLNAMLAAQNILRYNSSCIPKVLAPCMACFHQNVKDITKSVFETFFYNKLEEISVQEYVFVAMSKGYVLGIADEKWMKMNVLSLEEKYTHEWLHYEACVQVYHAMVWFCHTQQRKAEIVVNESPTHWRTKKRNRDCLYTVKELLNFFVEECKDYRNLTVPTDKRLRRLWKAFLWRMVLQSDREMTPKSILFISKDL